MTDLLSLALRLQALPPTPETPDAKPGWWGRAAHALLLRALQPGYPALAGALHAGDGLRPLTVSNLLGRFPQRRVVPGGAYALRYTACSAELAEALLQTVQSGPLSPGSRVDLDGFFFQVTGCEPAGTPAGVSQPEATRLEASDRFAADWTAATSFQELSAPYLLSQRPAPRRIALQLASPTSFKSGGMQAPLPLPGLVFGSLLEKWNAFAPIAFPPEVRRYAEECLAVSRFELSSRAVQAKEGGHRVGAVGQVEFVSLNYDRYWMCVIAILAEYALFSGVGVGGAMGLGQCRVVDVEGRRSAGVPED